ncbi:Glycosyltransferase involved in cell wall bisynthesis [Pelosinus fermentans]|uniref:glycosyltransferase n=1 Tax=Pelosinus fermentans TaxID=365349 RepID=UPI0002685C17|nr:glycosyltransferase [Pelosinus fermentans]OAM92764.1 glycosyl transferase group 1 [Pelosinus fermentans DSM 17108]SDQ56162.1 Glycosyltransferase involved in cell wall bisynthesis [Pelosinus fermentans]
MNILILFSQPWRVGGAETHVEALIKGLADHKIILAVNRGSNNEKLQKIRQEYENIEIIEVQARGINIFQWIMDLYKLAGIIKNKQIQIISAQQRTAGIWACFLNKFTNVPFIVTMHDPWHRALCKQIYSNIFPIMIVVSQSLNNLLMDKFGFKAEQIHFVNNGIDFDLFVPQDKILARNILGLSKTDEIILHVSRLSNVKGAVSLALIDSMYRVVSQRGLSKLIIIGEGPLRAELEQKVETFNQKYGNVIEIKDFVNNISDWYNASDVIVGEGRVAIEAIACGRPVVAIRNGKHFFGIVDDENISMATEVNFDGITYQVTPEQVAKEIDKAFQATRIQAEKISRYIRERLGIAEMAQKYQDLFKKRIRGNAYEKNSSD